MELKFNEGMRLDVLRESSNRTFMELKLSINLYWGFINKF